MACPVTCFSPVNDTSEFCVESNKVTEVCGCRCLETTGSVRLSRFNDLPWSFFFLTYSFAFPRNIILFKIFTEERLLKQNHFLTLECHHHKMLVIRGRLGQQRHNSKVAKRIKVGTVTLWDLSQGLVLVQFRRWDKLRRQTPLEWWHDTKKAKFEAFIPKSSETQRRSGLK